MIDTLSDMNEDTAAEALAALGHPARLQTFRLLVKAGHDGLKVGDIAAHLGMPGATLTHHLSSLVQAGLVTQERQGRQIVNRADFERMQQLIGFLSEECCTGFSAVFADDLQGAKQ